MSGSKLEMLLFASHRGLPYLAQSEVQGEARVTFSRPGNSEMQRLRYAAVPGGSCTRCAAEEKRVLYMAVWPSAVEEGLENWPL